MDIKINNIIEKLMKEHGQSFYLYDESLILRQADILLKNFPQFEFLYSIKTNPFQPIVDGLARKGFGADAASREEVYKSVNAGLPYEKILYSTPGKTKKDIEKTIDKAIIIADSYNELILINDIALKKGKHVKVGLRINPDFNMDGLGCISSKFGLDQSFLSEKKDLIDGLSNIKISGIHVHLKSQVLDYKKLYSYYKNIYELALYCKEELNYDMDFINFGGGIGLAYSVANDSPLDIESLSGLCANLKEKYKDKINPRLIIETGRFVICQAGYYVTWITDIKESQGEKYLIVEKGLNGFMRPAIAELLSSNTDVTKIKKSLEPLFTVKDAFEFLIPQADKDNMERVNIVGSLCTATDVMVKDAVLPKANIGDVLIVTKAGSYSYSLSPLLFASHSLPLQFYAKENGDVFSQ